MEGPAAALPLLSTLARAYERELANPEAAIDRNRTILNFDARNSDAVLALERLYVSTGRHAELLAIYDKKLTLAGGEVERRHVQLQLASLYEDEIRDTERASGLYREILRSSPQDPQALRALDRLYRATGQWKELIDIVDRELEIATDAPTRAELMFRKGEVSEKELGQKKQAVEAYKDALALDPNQGGARAALEAYLQDKKFQLTAVSALEPIYEKLDDLAPLVEVLRIRLAHAKDAASRVALQLRIGALESALGHGEEAFAAYSEAFREDPTSQPAREALEELADNLGRWKKLVALYGEALGSRKLAPILERELLLRVAVAYDEKLGESQKAVEYFRRAQEIQPEDASALVALERLYTRTERWPDLVETLRKKADLLGSAEERERIRVHIATVWEEVLGNPEEAMAAWKDVLGDNPGSLQALRALDRLFQQRGLDLELADNLQRQLELTDDPDVVVLLLGRLGRLRQDRLSDLVGAVETYRRVLELSPVHLETIAALERMLPTSGAGAGGGRNARARVPGPRRLPQPHRGAGDRGPPHPEGARRDRPAARDRRGLGGRLRRSRARLRRPRPGAEREPDRGRDPAADRAAGPGPGAARRPGGPLREHRRRRAGRGGAARPLSQDRALAESGPGGDDRAAAAYVEALDLGGGDLDAANALEQIYLRSSNHARLVDLLRTQDRDRRQPRGEEAARLQGGPAPRGGADRPGEGHRGLPADPGRRRQRPHRARPPGAPLHPARALGRPEGHLRARRRIWRSSPAEKKQMLFVLGQVYDRELQRSGTRDRDLQLDPRSGSAKTTTPLQALDRLYQQTERWYDLLAVLERQTELAPVAGRGACRCASASASCGAST